MLVSDVLQALNQNTGVKPADRFFNSYGSIFGRFVASPFLSIGVTSDVFMLEALPQLRKEQTPRVSHVIHDQGAKAQLVAPLLHLANRHAFLLECNE